MESYLAKNWMRRTGGPVEPIQESVVIDIDKELRTYGERSAEQCAGAVQCAVQSNISHLDLDHFPTSSLSHDPYARLTSR